MISKKAGRSVRMIAIFLVVVMLFPVGAMAVEARSSRYLDSYGARNPYLPRRLRRY